MRRRDLSNERGSGVLLHVTSLPGPFGCGDLGPAAHEFLAQLGRARQRYWQMLPICPVGAGHAPYSSPSSFAGSPLLVSPQILAREGLLSRAALRDVRSLPAARVDYPSTERVRESLLREAFATFCERGSRREQARFDAFRHRQRAWLDDHVLFMALRTKNPKSSWTEWERGLRLREPRALARAREAHAEEIAYHAFVQFQFDRQWRALSRAARAQGIQLVGDLPFYVEHDSADAWAHRGIFSLDRSGRPSAVAGVAPDGFTRNGQLWGNPLFNWPSLARTGYAWWMSRLERALDLFDVVRLDHFIAFHRAWAVPSGARTARRGNYRPGPGARFFSAVRSRLGGLPFIAEDLGTLVPEVHALRDRFDLHGMRVLQFSFSGGPGADARPFGFPRRSVIYTGTHDNNTTLGWFRERGGGGSPRTAAQAARERTAVLDYLGTGGKEVNWDFIRLALMNAANIAMVPLQDILGLGAGARMNRPGTPRGNWEWRFQEGALTDSKLKRLAELTWTYGRTSERPA